MLETSARLLRLLALFQARRFWSGTELAQRLGVTERTVRRDVDRLRGLGYPVHATSGVAGGYQLGAGASLPPLLLDDDEALAVALGLRTAVQTVSGLEEAALRALVKVEQVLPARLQKRLRTFHTSLVPLYMPRESVDLESVKLLATACRAHESVQFDYEDAEHRASRRDVEPYGMVTSGARWYLVAWDREREDFRSFRVDRITGRPVTGTSFSPRPLPDGDLATYVSRSISTRAYPHQARVILKAPLEVVARKIPPLAARLQRVDDVSCRLEAGAPSLDMLAAHIAALGFDFEVEEPKELVERFRELEKRLKRATAGLSRRKRSKN